MDGLVSLLPEPHYQQVESIWDELKDTFQLTGIRVTPYPHFSWQIAEYYDELHLKEVIRQLASEVHRFSIRTSGIGIFSGSQPVIYVPIVKNRALIECHTRIWERAAPIAAGGSPALTIILTIGCRISVWLIAM